MKLAGKGTWTMERELNNTDIWQPPLSGRNKTGGWRKSYIDKILTNPAVHGEYQPCIVVREYSETIDKKARRRKPIGDPIPDYYPEIVKPEIFFRVQALIKQNSLLNGRGGGKNW
jgi:hypothetical protein